jgi:hypothetical protein
MSGRGRSLKNSELISHARDILEEINPATVRGVCYQLFSRGHIDGMTKKNVANVGRLLTVAREEGSIPWSHIVDETRREETVAGWNGLSNFGETVTRSYRRSLWDQQPAWIKVFSEKATIGGVVRPVLREFGVDFQVMHGYGSATSLHDVAMESLTKPKALEILYIGDFDPSGMHMSEVDLPERIERYEGVVDVTRIALTQDDCDDLPSFDAESKQGDPRHQWFTQNYGDTCWELDANPNDLRERLRKEIMERIDVDIWHHWKKVEDAERESLNRLIKLWPGVAA